MTVQCVTCRQFSLKSSAMAKHGLGVCKQGKPWEYQSPSYPRDCAKYSQADADTAQARMAWLKKQEGKTA